MPAVVILGDGETKSSSACPSRPPQAYLRENYRKGACFHEHSEADVCARRQARALRRRLRNRRWNTKSENKLPCVILTFAYFIIYY